MVLEKIELKNFRNYIETKIDFKSGKNIFVGNNAQGKTNIIEAIFLLGLTKSYRIINERVLINKGKNALRIKGTISSQKTTKKLEIIINKEKKVIKKNNKKIRKL